MGEVANSSGSFIDSPVFNIIDYFNSMFHAYLTVAIKLGILLALCGLIWNCFQVVFGLQESRKLIVGTVSKWMLFIVILVFYPSVTKGLKTFSIQMAGYVSGRSTDSLTEGLVKYLNTLEEMVTLDDPEVIEEKISKLIEARAELESAWANSDEKWTDESFASVQS